MPSIINYDIQSTKVNISNMPWIVKNLVHRLNIPTSNNFVYCTSLQLPRRYCIVKHISTYQAKKDGSRNVNCNSVSFNKWIHCSPTLSYEIGKPPLNELENVNVVISRKLYLGKKCFYFDCMEEKDSGIRFVKISEVITKSNTRDHVLVSLEDLPEFTNKLAMGKNKEIEDDVDEPYEKIEESKVFGEKRYEFKVWHRSFASEKVHIQIKETGRTYANLIKNRDPDIEYGTFRLLISKYAINDFIAELDAILYANIKM